MNRLRLAIDELLGFILPFVMLALPFSIGMLPKGPIRITAASVLGAVGIWIIVGNWMMVWRNLVHRESHSPVPFFGCLFAVPIFGLTGDWLGWPDWVSLVIVVLLDPGTGSWAMVCSPYLLWRHCRR